MTDNEHKKIKNRYSFSEFVKTAYSFIMTKLTMPQARMIRRPIYIRGGGALSGAKGLTTGRFCRFDLDGSVNGTLKIGNNCEFGDNTHIVAHKSVCIGNNVLIASKVFISDTNHGNYKGRCEAPSVPPKKRKFITGTVRIGDNVWIGENAVILSGSDIGSGCVIGANSVVSEIIPENSIVVGCNRIVRQYV